MGHRKIKFLVVAPSLHATYRVGEQNRSLGESHFFGENI